MTMSGTRGKVFTCDYIHSDGWVVAGVALVYHSCHRSAVRRYIFKKHRGRRHQGFKNKMELLSRIPGHTQPTVSCAASPIWGSSLVASGSEVTGLSSQQLGSGAICMPTACADGLFVWAQGNPCR